MNMEIRKGHIIAGTAGGTAGRQSRTYKVSIPSAWVTKMNLNHLDNGIELLFDGTKIILQARQTLEQFVSNKKKMNHELKCFKYYNENNLCTIICADFTDETLIAENYTQSVVKTAFGVNDAPTWKDFLSFLEERCVPRKRDGIQYYLEALRLDDYNPLDIIQKTQGRMAEDQQWMTVEEI